MKNARKLTGSQVDEILDYIAYQEHQTGLNLEETGLYTIVKLKGGSISFADLDAISKESLEELKAIVSQLEQKGYASVDGDIINLLEN